METNPLIEIIFAYYKENPTLIITNLLFLFLVPISDVVVPHMYGKVIEAIQDSIKEPVKLFKPFFYVVIVLVIVNILYLFSDYHDSKILPDLQSFVQNKMVDRVLENYENEHKELESGELITKIIKLPMTIKLWFENIKNYIIPYCLVFLFAVIYFIFIDLQLGIWLFIVLSIFLAIMLCSPVSCSNISKEKDIYFNKMYERIDDLFRNLFSIYGANQKSAEIEKLKGFSLVHNKLYQNTMLCVLKYKSWLTPLIVGYLIFFVWRCYNLVKLRRMKAAQFVSLFIILLYVLGGTTILNDHIRDIIIEWGIIIASSDIIYKLPKKSITPTSYMGTIIPQLPGIGFRDITYTYPNTTTQVLKGVTLHINKGDIVCIIGDIGSGKSTLLKLLLKYHQVDSGTVYLDGVDYNSIPLENIRKRIGYVPQQPVLFNRSILENILYGNPEYTRADVEAILVEFGIYEDFNRKDCGLDTIIGKNGSKLSGGQRQLIWCLRVLLSNPEIVILDEPTASIDEKTKIILHKMLSIIMKNKTIIMISHDPWLVDIASRVVRMQDGRIIEDTHNI